MRRLFFFAVLLSAGCASTPPDAGKCEYREIPSSYLQECPLPALPGENGDLSEALVQAYQCAEQSNNHKARIRELLAD